MKPATLALNLLTVLICLAPLAWWVGVEWEKVAIAAGMWLVLWVMIAAKGRQREGAE